MNPPSKVANPTHGSGWIVSSPAYKQGDSTAPVNPTHGSGWIVQVQPTKRAGRRPFNFVIAFACGATEGADEKRESRYAPLCRLDLNDPPTAVGGIRGRRREASLCRPHLNDPPTAVGGIPTLDTISQLTWPISYIPRNGRRTLKSILILNTPAPFHPCAGRKLPLTCRSRDRS